MTDSDSDVDILQPGFQFDDCDTRSLSDADSAVDAGAGLGVDWELLDAMGCTSAPLPSGLEDLGDDGLFAGLARPRLSALLLDQGAWDPALLDF